MRTRKKKDPSSFKNFKIPEDYAEAIISELESEAEKELKILMSYFDNGFIHLLESKKDDLSIIVKKVSAKEKEGLIGALKQYNDLPGIPIGKRKHLIQKEKEQFLEKMLGGSKAKDIASSFIAGLIHLPIKEEVEVSEL
jgi:hypothetical protein